MKIEDAPMQALVIDSDRRRKEQAQLAFLEVGIQAAGFDDLDLATACLARARIDVLLVEKKAVEPRLLELLHEGEARNGTMVTMLLTPDLDCDVARYHGISPSLHCLLDDDVDPRLVAKLALSSMMDAAGLALPVRVAPRVPPRAGAVPVFHSARGPRRGSALLAG